MGVKTWSMSWSGGQYSVVRAVVAGSVAVAALSRFVSSPRPIPLLLAAAAAGVAVGAGRFEKAAAALLAAVLVVDGPSYLPAPAARLAAFCLVVHLLLPPAPFGSVAAKGRVDPSGGWTMPAWYPVVMSSLFLSARFLAAMLALSDGEAYGVAMAAAGALACRERTALLGWQLSLATDLLYSATGELSFVTTALFHLVTFQPAWLPRRELERGATVFYDGSCALCHGAVRFVLAEDRPPASLRLSPLFGDAWQERVPASQHENVPDSVVLLRRNELLLRSDAALAIAAGLGGLWRLLGAAGAVVPRPLRDAAYDAIAARRYRWFGRRSEACPMLPVSLRGRIEA